MVQEVKYCTKCGKELPENSVFCPYCGTNIQSGYGPFSERFWRSREYRRERRRGRGDWWGAVTAVGFFVIIGATIIKYPDVFTRIIDYFTSFGVYGHPVLPSYALGQVIVYFFLVSGVWGIVAAALRFAFTGAMSKAAQDAVGGIFALYISNAFAQFYSHSYGGWGLIGILAVGLVVVIVANALIAFLVPGESTRQILR